MKTIDKNFEKTKNRTSTKNTWSDPENDDAVNTDISPGANFKYLLAGTFFGIVFLKAEIISWFRMQEMFRFQSFFMYGVIGSALVTGMISIALIKKYNARALDGKKIQIAPKIFNK